MRISFWALLGWLTAFDRGRLARHDCRLNRRPVLDTGLGFSAVLFQTKAKPP
jgi:hypothetical protein